MSNFFYFFLTLAKAAATAWTLPTSTHLTAKTLTTWQGSHNSREASNSRTDRSKRDNLNNKISDTNIGGKTISKRYFNKSKDACNSWNTREQYRRYANNSRNTRDAINVGKTKSRREANNSRSGGLRL
jgi:hypothetical protein